MGLDTTHDAWHGSYSGFALWRNDLARVLGWGTEVTPHSTTTYAIPEGRVPQQDPLPDETHTVDGETYTIRWSEHYGNSVWLGHWDTDPADVIDVLMIHSDCDGIIPHRFMERLCHRLMDVMEQQEPDSWERKATGQFCVGLIEAHIRGEDIEFH